MSNLKCVPKDSFINICRSADTGAVWITNFGRITKAQVKGKCRRIRKNTIGFRHRRHIRATRSHVKGVMTQENGIIQDKIGWQKKTYKFSCPNNSVIYSFDFRVSSVPNTRRAKTICQGYSPQLLVQKNNCFWKNSCRVSWNYPQVITTSADPRCIGQRTSLFTTKEHQCMPKDRIHDVCKKRDTKGRRGLLRSHKHYPWNYNAIPQNCTTRIKITHGGALFLHLHDIDLDSSHDALRVVHVRSSVTCPIPDSSLREGVWLQGGYVRVLFNVAYRSKRGRGFIMSYKNVKERVPNSPEDNNDKCPQYAKN
uniref:Uncharacterized protein LOC111127374 n=1 Tax=Crassostrea virginica TaxID=6565 RepID=A0A8B8DMN2_CRAVI|nr:uncharacterized protein LOC111127374 [Crassostrea virginica]